MSYILYSLGFCSEIVANHMGDCVLFITKVTNNAIHFIEKNIFQIRYRFKIIPFAPLLQYLH